MVGIRTKIALGFFTFLFLGLGIFSSIKASEIPVRGNVLRIEFVDREFKIEHLGAAGGAAGVSNSSGGGSGSLGSSESKLELELLRNPHLKEFLKKGDVVNAIDRLTNEPIKKIVPSPTPESFAYIDPITGFNIIYKKTVKKGDSSFKRGGIIFAAFILFILTLWIGIAFLYRLFN